MSEAVSRAAVCTGVSLDAREDPRWTAYGLKVEIVGARGRYLAEETLRVRQGGKGSIEV